MVNMVRIGPTTAEDDPQIEAAKQQVALAIANMRQGGSPAGVPLAQGAGAVQAKYGIGNALLDVANKLAQGYAVGQANSRYGALKAQQDAALTRANEGKLDSLAPMIQGGQKPTAITLDSLSSPQAPTFQAPDLSQGRQPRALSPVPPQPADPAVTMNAQTAVPDQANPARAMIASVLAGQDPRSVGNALSGLQLRNAFPDPAVEESRKMRQAMFDAGENDKKASRVQSREIADQSDARIKAIAEQGHQDRLAAAAAKEGKTPDGQLSPDAVDDAVIDVLADKDRMRQYASFGNAGQANRTIINNAKATKLRALGMTEQQVIRQQAIAKAEIKSIGDLVPMKNAVGAYETLARGNGERFLELTKAVNKSGVPLINSAERLGKLATGSEDAAEMMQVLHNYQVEAARIVTQPSLKGQLTDQAIADIKGIVPANVTVGQAARIINRLNFEFALRERGLDQQIDLAGGALNPGSTPTPTPRTPMTQAPQAALDMLKTNPEMAPKFKEKYGYLPGG